MIESAHKLEIAIYLRGDDLNPSYVSALLGLEPSRSQFKGEKKITSTNKEFVARVGFWALAAEATSNDLAALVGAFVSRIENRGVVFAEITGVQEAYVDVFFAVDADDEGGGTCAFQLSQENLRSLERLGMPVRFTAAVVRP